MIEGRLPNPRGPIPAIVEVALRAYYRAYCDPRSTPAGRQRARAVVRMRLETMTRRDLAHYYAGVRRLNGPLGDCRP